MVAASRLEGIATLPPLSPYWFPASAQEEFRKELAGLVPEEELGRLVPEEQVTERNGRPLLLVGAVDVINGEFMVFSSEGPKRHTTVTNRKRNELKYHRLTLDSIVASAAVPPLLRAVHVNGGVCWDGLFSQNPPVHDLPDAPATRPDEIWIVQINPQAARRANVPVGDHQPPQRAVGKPLALPRG